jgi:hypothetical protein
MSSAPGRTTRFRFCRDLDPRPVKKGVPRLLGFADNDRVIVGVQRGRSPTVVPRRPE